MFRTRKLLLDVEPPFRDKRDGIVLFEPSIVIGKLRAVVDLVVVVLAASVVAPALSVFGCCCCKCIVEW